MTTILTVQPGPTHYSTREQLYALCVLMCWADGISLNNAAGSRSVTLNSRSKGNTGFSAYMLEVNPNVTDVKFVDAPSVPHSPIFFKVLGVWLEVAFDDNGVGEVTFPEQPFAETL